MNIIKKNKIILILLSIAIILLMIKIFTVPKKGGTLQIISLLPFEQTNLEEKDELIIKIIFNQNIENFFEQVSLTSEPSLVWQKEKSSLETILFSASGLLSLPSSAQLNLKLTYQDSVLKEWFYHSPPKAKITPFPTIDPNASYVPNEEIIKGLKKEREQADRDLPLWQSLPYETEDFKISHYIRPFTLVVYITDKSKQQIVEKEVLNWVKEKGGDPSIHKIEWREKE